MGSTVRKSEKWERMQSFSELLNYWEANTPQRQFTAKKVQKHAIYRLYKTKGPNEPCWRVCIIKLRRSWVWRLRSGRSCGGQECSGADGGLCTHISECGARVSLGLAEIGLPVQGGDAIVLEMLAGKAHIFNCCRWILKDKFRGENDFKDMQQKSGRNWISC